jgi:type IV pilus assembly protein PilM
MEFIDQIKERVEFVKDILKIGPRHFVGIDIGQSSIRFAEVKHTKKGPYIVNFHYEPLPEAALIDDEIQKPEEIVEVIKKGLQESGIKANFAIIGLFGHNVVSKRLQLAGGTSEDIDDQINWEGDQYFPFSMDQCSYSFHIFGENQAGGVDVFVGASRTDILNNFRELVEKAGLKVKIIDLINVAFSNVFEKVYEDELKTSKDTYLLLDLGAQKTGFIIYKNGGISFSKEINIGGVIITEEIQRRMGVSYFEAEDLKMNGDEEGNLPEEVLDIMDEIVESFFKEIKKTVDFYISSTGEEDLNKCIITGGNTLIPNLAESLSELLEMEVDILDPLEYFQYDEDLDEEVIDEIRYRGVVALGLALRTPKE